MWANNWKEQTWTIFFWLKSRWDWTPRRNSPLLVTHTYDFHDSLILNANNKKHNFSPPSAADHPVPP